MLWLPALCSASGAAPIAVADASAVAVESALLEPSGAVDILSAALLVDPWMCRWANACPAVEAATVAELAEHLADGLSRRLASAAPHTLAYTRVDEVAARDFAQQAAGILARATQALPFGEPALDSPGFYREVASAPVELGEATNDYLRCAAGIEWRLPRLVQRLAWFEELSSDFDTQLEQAKLDAMKELAYGASHEVNNPLANISGRAQALLRDETDSKRRRMLTSIDANAIRAHEMISDLMLFARPPALELEATDLGELLDKVAGELTTTADEQAIKLVVEPASESFTAAVDPTQMMVAVTALVQNSLDAIGHDGQVTLSVKREANQAVLRVADTGPGIAEEVRHHMFDPFYSGREAGRGLGFGLSKCWRIVTLHGGNVKLESTGPAGSVFAVRMPLSTEES